MSTPCWRLSVSRPEFAKALRLVGRAGRDVRSGEAILTFDGGRLIIDLSGNVAQVAATGAWPSEVRLPGGALERLAKSLPEGNPLDLKVEGDRLLAARFAMPCKWSMLSRPGTPVPDLIPANADPFQILMIRTRCSDAEIDAAGATGLIAEAERRIDSTCEAAARILHHYGVSPAHLRKLCDEHAADGSRKFSESDGVTIGQIAKAWQLLAPLGVEPDELKALMDDCLRNAWRHPK